MTPRARDARRAWPVAVLVTMLGLVMLSGPAYAATATTTSVGVTPLTQARAGTPVTLTATVSPSSATGTVQFTDNGANLGAAVTLSGGTAVMVTSSLSVARHSLSAVYTPADGTFVGSNADLAPATLQVVSVLGQLTLSPQTGSNTDAPNVTLYTPSGTPGCPVGSRSYRVNMTGPGAWVTGFLVIPSSSIPGSSATFGGGDFSGPFQDTFAGISASNSAPLVTGKYDITLYCTNALGSSFFGAFTTSIWFTSSTAWRSTDPSGSPTPTTTGLVPSPPSPAAPGTAVTLTATVTPSVPGTFTFKDGTTTLGSAPVVAGSGSFTSSTFLTGPHSFTAGFTPLVTGAQAPSSSPVVPYSIVAAGPQSTTTTLGVSPATSAVQGANVTITATVSPSSAQGSVQFSDNGLPTGSAVPVAGGTAQLSTSGLAVGGHSFTASFTPTDSTAFSASSTPSSTTYTITAPVPISTTTTLGVSPASTAAPGTPVTITATVSPSGAAGTVQFFDSAVSMGSPVPVSGGTAHVTTSTLLLGAHSFTATFTPGNPTAYNSSSTPSATPYVIATVTQSPTSTSLVVGPAGTATTAVGQTVTMTATVSPAGAAGSVQFTDNGTAIASPVAVAAGTATLNYSALASGSHSLAATFVPTDPASFAGSASASVAHQVITAPVLGGLKAFVTTGSLSDFGTASDPMTVKTVSTGSPAGCRPLGSSAVTVRGSVTGPGGWAPGITVISTTGAQVSTTADFEEPLADTFTGLAASNSIAIVAGRYDITLECRQNNGVVGSFTSPIWFTDSTHWQSTDPSSTAAVTTSAVVASPDGYSFRGSPLKLTATVTPANATGTVHFTNTVSGSTATVGGPVPVVNGVATWTTSTLAVGLYTLNAVFVPSSGAFLGSTSDALTYMVRLPSPPVPLSVPTTSGTALLWGRLTCSLGGWANGPTSFSRVWLRNGAAIAGATASAYTIQLADVKALVSCRVYATNAGGRISATSVARRIPVPAAASRVLKAPVLSGTSRAGRQLTSSTGSWSPRPTAYTYQWLRDGHAIPGATHNFFVVRSTDRRHRISCIVYSHRVGALVGRAVTRSVLIS